MVSEGVNVSSILKGLISYGLRPTRQRKLLAKFIFSKGNHHFSAEEICRAVRKLRAGVSRATVYNTLNQFTEAGFLREVVVSSGQSLFDTNLDNHYHFYDEVDGKLIDIPGSEINVSLSDNIPFKDEITDIDVVIRLQPA